MRGEQVKTWRVMGMVVVASRGDEGRGDSELSR